MLPEHAEPTEIIDADARLARHRDGRSDAANRLDAWQVSGHGCRLRGRSGRHGAGLLLRLLVTLPQVEDLNERKKTGLAIRVKLLGSYF